MFTNVTHLGRDDRWLNSIRNPKSKTVLIFLLTKDNKHISKISIYFDASRDVSKYIEILLMCLLSFVSKK